MLDVSININETLIILFRIVLAVVLAFIPGIERELTGKFAGLRTHILVCLGACVFTILSVYGLIGILQDIFAILLELLWKLLRSHILVNLQP